MGEDAGDVQVVTTRVTTWEGRWPDDPRKWEDHRG
jgi:hypothetical protein